MSWIDENPNVQAALDQVNQMQNDAIRVGKYGAMVELAYLVAAANGDVKADERTKIKTKMEGIIGSNFGRDHIGEMLESAADKLAEHGVEARYRYIAEALDNEAERESGFLVAAHCAWDGGVDVKEGLALQAIAKVFGWEINHMHKLLGKAKG